MLDLTACRMLRINMELKDGVPMIKTISSMSLKLHSVHLKSKDSIANALVVIQLLSLTTPRLGAWTNPIAT
jgi:hypothetical protein